MDSTKYLKALAKRLKKLPPAEMADAMAYYAEYFEEAGPEHADEAAIALGTPNQLAAAILAEHSMRSLNDEEPKVKQGLSAVWFSIIGVFAIPVGLPLAIVGVALIFAFLVVIFAVLISLFAAAISLILGGIAIGITGFIVITQDGATSAFYIGCGLACVGIGLFLFVGILALTRVTLKGLAKLFNRIRYRKIDRKIRKQAAAGYAPPNYSGHAAYPGYGQPQPGYTPNYALQQDGQPQPGYAPNYTPQQDGQPQQDEQPQQDDSYMPDNNQEQPVAKDPATISEEQSEKEGVIHE